MSKYTTEVRYICESLAGLEDSVGYNDTAEVIEAARPLIFSFDYPIFDNAYKQGLETKIIRHFYTREIGAETYGLWKLWLEAKMNEIMPLYNQFYESAELEFNPLYDADYHRDTDTTENSERERAGTQGRTSTNSGSDTTARTKSETAQLSGTDTTTKTFDTEVALGGSDVTNTDGETTENTETHNRDYYSEWDLYSDTPQGGIAGITGAEDPPSLADNGYLTNARHIIHDGDGTEATGELTSTEDKDVTTTYGRTEEKTGTETTGTQHGKKNTISGSDSETVTHGKVNTIAATDSQTLTEDREGQSLQHIYGRLGGRTPAELLLEYRKTFLNIDMMIIKDLEPLFFGLW